MGFLYMEIEGDYNYMDSDEVNSGIHLFFRTTNETDNGIYLSFVVLILTINLI